MNRDVFDKDVNEKIVILSKEKQIILGLMCIYRQCLLVKLFDSRYSESLYLYFKDCLNCIHYFILSRNILDNKLNDMYMEIFDKTPDTEEFSAIEGSYAQNVMVSIYYLYAFILNDIEKITASLDKAMENIGLIVSEKTNSFYDEKTYRKEQDFINILIDKISDMDVVTEENFKSLCYWINDKLIDPSKMIC